jgi:hypothetical protein
VVARADTSLAGTPVRRSQARFQIMTRALLSSTKTGIASISISWCAKARSAFALELGHEPLYCGRACHVPSSICPLSN